MFLVYSVSMSLSALLYGTVIFKVWVSQINLRKIKNKLLVANCGYVCGGLNGTRGRGASWAENLNQRMSELSLVPFWLQTEFPHLSQKAQKVLIPFTSAYLCECRFSILILIKSKYRSRLRVGDDLPLFLSIMHPHITRPCASKTHCPHQSRYKWT